MDLANHRKIGIKLLLLLSILCSGNAIAQKSKVVVVPLGGDVSATDFNALARRVPFALGRILSSGTVDASASTGNFSSVYNNSLDRYEIDFDDVSFSIVENTASATIIGSSGSCPGGASARISSFNGKLLVYIIASNGDNIQCGFNFQAYDNDM
ncbi:MAG: hypothetical protein MK188_12375 [Gammaproteobacteria bacterium]|nr:hypothetical protein [Gammaproteobacteria bacterium]